jgi:hypothetical protein
LIPKSRLNVLSGEWNDDDYDGFSRPDLHSARGAGRNAGDVNSLLGMARLMLD